jgi:integrase
MGRTAKFADFALQYLKDIAAGQGSESPATVDKETSILGRWVQHLGHLRLNQIERVNVDEFIKPRRKGVDEDGNPMATRLAPDSKWLFPSLQRGEEDIRTKSFRESLDMVRGKAGMPNFGFHDLRNHFIRMCFMSGIDFMTIAAWVGHKDGGVLIGKVYGHLSNEHAQAQAARMNFGSTVVPLPQAATV